MPRLAIDINASGSWTRISGSYDSTKWSLGSIINQNTSSDGTLTFIGPNPVAIARPFDESTSVACRYPYVITFSNTIDWVFLTEGIPVSNVVRVFLYEYNKVNSTYTWKGYISCRFNTQTTHTIRGFRMHRHLHTTGSASPSGSRVTGASTRFISDRIGVGARIGFGTTDPTVVGTWYPITAIGSDTGLTMSVSIATASYQPYVIEEIRALWSTTNATPANGGVFITKGINYSDFIPGGTTILSSSAGLDNQKLGYWLADASTVTNTGSCGLVIGETMNALTQSIYVLETSVGGLTAKVFKYNAHASGSMTLGKFTNLAATGGVVFTGLQPLTGIISQVNNGRLASTSHSAGSGSQSIYFVTATRIYRTDVTKIFSGNAAWISDCRIEMPPGNINTYPATNALQSLEYIDSIDRFIILSTGATSNRHYVTEYPTNSSDEFDHIFGLTTLQLDSSSLQSGSGNVPRYDIGNQAASCWSENGITHIVKHGTTSTDSQMYAMPLAAHWTYADTTLQRAITPEIYTPNCYKYVNLYLTDTQYLGDTTIGENAGVATEPYRVHYRTTGIKDNTGGWYDIMKGDMSSVGPAPSIQFMFEFKTIGNGYMLPTQLLNLAIVYDDLTTDIHFQPSVINSSLANKTFAWRHSTAFGSAVPPLRVRLYQSINNTLLIDDTTTGSLSGAWGKSIDSGSTWTAYNTTDKANEATYIRYIPTSLMDGTPVRALLTQ